MAGRLGISTPRDQLKKAIPTPAWLAPALTWGAGLFYVDSCTSGDREEGYGVAIPTSPNHLLCREWKTQTVMLRPQKVWMYSGPRKLDHQLSYAGGPGKG